MLDQGVRYMKHFSKPIRSCSWTILSLYYAFSPPLCFYAMIVTDVDVL